MWIRRFLAVVSVLAAVTHGRFNAYSPSMIDRMTAEGNGDYKYYELSH